MRKSEALTVKKIDIVETQLYGCVGGSNVIFHLSEDSSDGVGWKVDPDGVGPFLANYSSSNGIIGPGGMTSNFTIIAYAYDNTNIFDTARIDVFKVDIEKLEFTSDHGVLIDYNTDYDGTNGPVFNPRGWTATGTNNPITQTKGTKLTANITLSFEPSGVAYGLTGDGSIGCFTFHTNGLTSSGSDQTFLLNADTNLPAQVDMLTNNITWSINIGGLSCIVTSSGPHKVYVTWGTPTGTAPTLKRMDWSVNLAKLSTNLDQIAEAIGPDSTSGNRFGGNSIFGSPPSLSTAWQVMDGAQYIGDCGTLATLMKYELDIVGATGAVVRFVYPRHASWIGLSQPSPPYESYYETNSIGSQLGMWFAGGLGAGWNNYEGCCDFRSKWWMGGYGFATNAAYNVLIYVTEPNADGIDNPHQCWESNITNAVAYPSGTP